MSRLSKLTLVLPTARRMLVSGKHWNLMVVMMVVIVVMMLLLMVMKTMLC